MLDSLVSEVWFIEDIYKKRLKRLGIEKIEDILFHFPIRYLDYSKILSITELSKLKTRIELEENQSFFSVVGKIEDIKTIRSKYKKIYVTEAIIGDDNGNQIRTVWFNQPYLSDLIKNKKVSLAGRIEKNKLTSPDYEIIDDKKELIHTCRLISIYPLTRGITSRWYRYIVKTILDKYLDEVSESIPEKIRKKYSLISIKEALKEIHFPTSFALAQKARYYFSFEKSFLIQLSTLREKKKKKEEKAFKINFNLKKTRKLVNSLPFKLTQDQKISSWQILKDLEKNYPMNRLLQGDVGSGKTIVVVINILNVIDSGYQAVFMAPTEILAVQHFSNIRELLKDFSIKIGLLTSKNNKVFIQNKIIDVKTKAELLKMAENHEIDLLIGTHSLISSSKGNKLKFKKLAFVVLDEQHRFGVQQRIFLLKLSEKTPHNLSMTATPIPRTLMLTIYGNLNFSTIKEMPKGRKKIITKIITNNKRKDLYDFIKERVKDGEQVFVICPRIEKKEPEDQFPKFILSETKTVTKEFEKLSKIFSNLSLSMLHGRIKSEEKNRILESFRDKKIDILIATSLIEVGIDIPNATIMIIEGAEFFGLAQLHQLRGRIGRSDKQSYCFLFTEKEDNEQSDRLKTMEKTYDGFVLAEKDLEIRGAGDFIGHRQWGIPDVTMVALTDLKMIKKVKEAALSIFVEDSTLSNYPELKSRVNAFQQKTHLK